MTNPFRSSPQNRRRGESHPLDLRVESGPPVRPSRRRRRWWLRPVVTVASMVVLWMFSTVVVHLARERWLYHLDGLALRRIPVIRDGVLTDDEIRRIAGVSVGRNVLTIDLFEVRQRLLRNPRLAEARVRLEFPDQIQLEVRERIPIARALLPPVAGVEAYYLLDEEGHIILPFRPGRAPADVIENEANLPLITGIKVDSFTVGSAIDDERVRAALRLLNWFDNSELAGQTDVVSLDVAQPGALVALTSQGAQITFGLEDFDRQLRDWRAVQERANGLGKVIGTLDLSVRQNAPLRWLGANSTPASPPPVKVAHPHRKSIRRRV